MVANSTPTTKPLIYMIYMVIKGWWQRRRDSNPRSALTYTPLAGERLRPLGHVSVDPFRGKLKGGQEAKTLKLQRMFCISFGQVLHMPFLRVLNPVGNGVRVAVFLKSIEFSMPTTPEIELEKVCFDPEKDLLRRTETGKKLSALVEQFSNPNLHQLEQCAGTGIDAGRYLQKFVMLSHDVA